MREVTVRAIYDNKFFKNENLQIYNESNNIQRYLFEKRRLVFKRSITALEFLVFTDILTTSAFIIRFLHFFGRTFQARKIVVDFHLRSLDFVQIDKDWLNDKILALVCLRCKIEETFSILSTLGGAFSSLGEYDKFFASKAREISFSQLRLASVWQDPSIIARCGIFVVYSLCQLGLKRRARRLMKCAIHPYISKMIVNKCCDNALKNMYKAACYRIKL